MRARGTPSTAGKVEVSRPRRGFGQAVYRGRERAAIFGGTVQAASTRIWLRDMTRPKDVTDAW